MINAWEATVRKYGHQAALELIRKRKRIGLNIGKNTFYITDGKVTKRWPIGKEIPINWNKGRTLSNKSSST